MLHAQAMPDAVPVSFDEATVLAEFPEATPALARMVAELRMTDAFLRDPARATAPKIRQDLEARVLTLHSEIGSFRAATIPDIQLKSSVPDSILTTSGVDRRALVAYASWLDGERRHVCRELYPQLGWKAATFVVGDNAGFDYHNSTTPAPSTRAEHVLSLVGCDWRGDSYLGVGDTQSPAPAAPHFPHPDAQLMDLERDWRAARDVYDDVRAREDVALSEFHQLEDPLVGTEDHLLMHPPRSGALPGRILRDYWQATHIRQILAGRFIPPTAKDAERVDATPRAEFERLLPLVEVREARRNTLSERLGLERLETEAGHAFDVVEQAAKRVYRRRATTFEGLALKVRVLRTQESDLWKRPNSDLSTTGSLWHEFALTEIADGVEHLLATGRAAPLEAAGDPDPVLAAIAASRAAEAIMARWQARTNSKSGGLTEAMFAEEQELCAVQRQTRDVAFSTVPTTHAGRLALVEYVRFVRGFYGITDGDTPTPDDAHVWKETHATLMAALAASVGPSADEPASKFSPMTIAQLGTLYETVRSVWLHATAELQSGWCWDDKRENYNLAGRFLDAEGDRWAHFLDVIAAEIVRRTPATKDERDRSLETRLRHELNCEGRIIDRALLADINAAWAA